VAAPVVDEAAVVEEELIDCEAVPVVDEAAPVEELPVFAAPVVDVEVEVEVDEEDEEVEDEVEEGLVVVQ